jgi:hypothetical protein
VMLLGFFGDSLTFDTIANSSNTIIGTGAGHTFIAKSDLMGNWQWVELTTASDSTAPTPICWYWENNICYISIYMAGVTSTVLGNVAFYPASFTIPRSMSIAKYHFTTTGISTINDAQENTLKLFPNPAQDLLMLQSEEGIDYVEIYDMQGRKVWSQKWYGVPVSVAAIPQGVYFVLSFDAVGRQNGQGKLVVVR